MKRILFLALFSVLFAVAANAQSNSLTVINNTSCTIYYRVFGEAAGGTCTPTHQSGILSIAAGGITTFADPSTVTGGVNCIGGGCTPMTLGAADNFLGAELYHNSPACGSIATGWVGEVCSPFNATHNGWHAEDASCTPSCVVNATWAGGATLTFN